MSTAPVDAVELTLISDLTDAFQLILAAYDSSGKLLKTAMQPVTAGELNTPLTIAFPCDTDVAQIRVMAVDSQFRPVMSALDLT